MNYETLYDLGTFGYREGHWWPIGGALLLVALGLWLWQRRRGKRSPVPVFVGITGLFLSFGVAGVSLWDHNRLVAEFNAGRAHVVEGVVVGHRIDVTHTRRSSGSGYDRHVWEVFLVGDVAFGYRTNGAGRVGFSNGTAEPIDIRDGQRLRVHYVEDVPGEYTERRIVRLERAR